MTSRRLFNATFIRRSFPARPTSHIWSRSYLALPQESPPQEFLSQEPSSQVSYWSHIDRWKDVPPTLFMDHSWQIFHSLSRPSKLQKFLEEVLPDVLVPSSNKSLSHIKTKSHFIEDVSKGLESAPMNIRMTPHILSRIDWNNPLDDPIRRQFLPSDCSNLKDHPQLTFDSLHEQEDSPVEGLVHRYPGRALFLTTSICPVYCRFCTRAYAIGGDTATVTKKPQKPSRQRWEDMFRYIENTPSLHDIVVSGGDCFFLLPEQIKYIGERLLAMKHIQRFRFATKGLVVSPGRFQANDPWTRELIALSKAGRKLGKQVCLHTHFNHPAEMTWVTEKAANYLFEHGVIVRNQSVLLRGVNDDVDTMTELITKLSSLNVQPYYVYQCDMVKGVEDLRTPLSTILDLEKRIRGRVSGFMMPNFVVDLPGGGGKRLASTAESYDRETGISTWATPGLPGKEDMIYTYHDPHPIAQYVSQQKDVSLDQPVRQESRKQPTSQPGTPLDANIGQVIRPETPRSNPIRPIPQYIGMNRGIGDIPIHHQEAPSAAAGAI